jgi:hypothetical protein
LTGKQVIEHLIDGPLGLHGPSVHEKQGNEGNLYLEERDAEIPVCICAKCGQKRKKNGHHILPGWIVRCLRPLGYQIDEAEANKTVDLCNSHHQGGIEKINQLYSAVVMVRHQKQYAEILKLYIAGKDYFTLDELNVLADGGSLIEGSGIVEQTQINQEVREPEKAKI